MRRLSVCLCLLLLASVSGGPASARQEEQQKWDVTEPLGPTTKLEFDTSEGTWMNVDVSPDGRTVVFDLLGDIYAMPIEGTGGGRATRLTSGPAFDMQPRFSPDGRLILRQRS